MARTKKGQPADPGVPAVGTEDAVPATADAKPKKKRGKGAGKNGGKRKGGEPRTKVKNDAAAIELAKKRAEALEYRVQGYTYREIGEQMGVTAQTAYNWVVEEIRQIPKEAADNVRERELAVLDKMQTVVLQTFLDAPEEHLANTLFKIMDRRNRFLGLTPADDGGDGLSKLGRAMGQGFAASLKADEPVMIRPDEAPPANPVL